MSKKANPPPPVPFRGALSLLVLGLSESVLALFQWSQLLTLRSGGSTVCGFSETLNCETVWNSPFASFVQDTFRLPVAGLGLVWGITASALAALYLAWRRSGHTVRPAINGLRLTAAAGLLSSLVFAAASLTSRTLCPTCLLTYVLVLGFAGVAWRGLPGPKLPQPGEWGRALSWSGGFAIASFVALLGPGLATPKASAGPAAVLDSAPSTAAPGSLEAWVRSLPSDEQQALSNALARYRRAPTLETLPPRRLQGPQAAPVRIIDWTDIRCPHCKSLVETMAMLEKRVPEGSMAVESRNFPIDGTCNPLVPAQVNDGTGVRCAAARALICLEQAPDFWELRERLFSAQRELDSSKVMAIASSGSTSRETLEACLNDKETTRKLHEDAVYADRYHLRGTPLVVINGREASPMPALLYALVMSKGNADDAAFRALPPPSSQQEAHAH